METGTVKLTPNKNLRLAEYKDPNAHGNIDGWTYGFLKRLIFSEGIDRMAQTLKCEWFIDVVSSYIPKIDKLMVSTDSNIFFIDLFVKQDESAIFRVHDGGRNNEPEKTLITQKIQFTDCTKTLRAYLCFENNNWKLFLPSEY
jgi:hypothetical protein